VVARGIVALYPPSSHPEVEKGVAAPLRGGCRKHFAARTGSAVVWRFPSDLCRERTSWLF